MQSKTVIASYLVIEKGVDTACFAAVDSAQNRLMCLAAKNRITTTAKPIAVLAGAKGQQVL